MRTPAEQWRVAIHESAHALACIDRGVSVLEVSIVGDDNSAGRVIHSEAACPIAKCVISLAGLVAECYIREPEPGRGAVLDFINLHEHGFNNWTADFRSRVASEAIDVVTRRWREIVKLATALVDRGRMTEADIHKTLEPLSAMVLMMQSRPVPRTPKQAATVDVRSKPMASIYRTVVEAARRAGERWGLLGSTAAAATQKRTLQNTEQFLDAALALRLSREEADEQLDIADRIVTLRRRAANKEKYRVQMETAEAKMRKSVAAYEAAWKKAVADSDEFRTLSFAYTDASTAADVLVEMERLYPWHFGQDVAPSDMNTPSALAVA